MDAEMPEFLEDELSPVKSPPRRLRPRGGAAGDRPNEMDQRNDDHARDRCDEDDRRPTWTCTVSAGAKYIYRVQALGNSRRGQLSLPVHIVTPR